MVVNCNAIFNYAYKGWCQNSTFIDFFRPPPSKRLNFLENLEKYDNLEKIKKKVQQFFLNLIKVDDRI